MKYIFLLITLVLLTSCGGANENVISDDDSTNTQNEEWLIPLSQIKDGGPGKDGIPSIDHPDYIDIEEVDFLEDADLVIGIVKNGQAFAYPHLVLDWHEIVNDGLFSDNPITISYCPLTGTAFGWKSYANDSRTTFGVSGLLYNANLILYDRNTNSYWSQLRLECINGELINETPSLVNIVETNWSTWRLMYPNSKVLSLENDLFRDYGTYPYGDYKTDHNYFIFPINPLNTILPSKQRVFAIIDNGNAKVYRFEDFENGNAIIDSFKGKKYLIIGNKNIINAFELTTQQSQITYEYDFNGSEVFFKDSEGNSWSIFGKNLVDEQAAKLSTATSVNGYWFAIAAFYPNPIIYQP